MATEQETLQTTTQPQQTALKGGLHLLIPVGIEITDVAAYFPPNLSYESWNTFGHLLKHVTKSVVYWRADWLSHGRKHYGNDAVAKAVEQLDLDLGELKQADTLNKLSERRSGVDKEHHFIIARSRLDAVAQHMWLELADKENLTARELEESIRAGQVVKLYAEDYQKRGGFASIEGLSSMWKMLRRQIGELWVEWTDKEIAAFLQYIEPIEAFADELRNKLRKK